MYSAVHSAQAHQQPPYPPSSAGQPSMPHIDDSSSPFLSSSYQSAQGTPYHDASSSFFDPSNDPAWFTPQLHPSSSTSSLSSQAPLQTGFVHYPEDEMVHDEAMLEDGFMEVLNDGMGYEVPAEEAYQPFRRYSEGDQPLAMSGTSDRQHFAQPHSYSSSPADSGLFQSGYTLAPPPPDQSASYSSSQLANASYALSSSSDVSPGMPLYAPDPSQAAYVPQQPRTVYGQYISDEMEVLQSEHSVDPTIYRSRSASSDSSYAPHSHYSTSLAPSPYIDEAGQHETFKQPQRMGRHSASASPLPTPAHSAPSSRRPSLAHANTQAAPEYAGRDVYASAGPVETSTAVRHHSFSGPISSAPTTPQQQQPSRKRSIDAGDGDYHYEPRRHSLQAQAQSHYAVGQAVSPSSARPARRSSQPASMPVTPTRPHSISRRRSSLTPGRNRPSAYGSSPVPPSPFAPSPSPSQPRTPTSRRPSAQAEAAFSPLVSTTSPSFSSSSRRHHPNLTIAVPRTQSDTQAYSNATTLPPQSAASTATSSFTNYRSPRYSPYPNSPFFSPYAGQSPYGTPATEATGFSAAFNGIDPDCLSPLGAAGAAAKARRRYSADQYPASSPSGQGSRAATYAEERRRASATATFAGSGGQRTVSRRASGAVSSGLASTAEEELHRTLAATSWDVEEPFETVGLGLEIGVEEMHLAPPPAPQQQVPSPITPVTPANFAQSSYAASIPVSVDPGEVLYAPPSAFSTSSADVGILEQQQQAAYDELFRRQQQTDFAVSRQPYGVESQQVRLEKEVQEYVHAEDRMALGEKTVVILNPKIAQRSYGNEKRLLAPPPMALLLGTSWWQSYDVDPTTSPDSSTASSKFSAFKAYTGSLPTPPSPPHRAQLAPEVYISISTDRVFPKQPATTSWISNEGTAVIERQEEDAPPIAGRAMSKGLAVSVPGELNKDVSTTVNAVVTICEPGTGDVESRVWARLMGKPITVISKPSKKRSVTAGGVSGLHHGSLVSLYNRTKTYTGSTRYLCTSGVQSIFPLHDWHSMTSGLRSRSFAPTDARETRFVAKTAAWDAFVVYAVDTEVELRQQNPPNPTYPKPPLNAVTFGEEPKPLYYNQTVVLQDLATGVVSPVLILRRIDTPSLCTGGGSPPSSSTSSSTSSSPSPPRSSHPVPRGEEPGEPVSQYRPIALEVFSPASEERAKEERESFLGVVEEEVGVHSALEGRTYARSSSSAAKEGAPRTPTTPISFAAQQQAEEEEGRGKKGGRRKAKEGEGAERGRVWTVPLGEHCIWSIAQIELERYSFFVPPSLMGGQPRSLNPPPTLNPMYNSPRPSKPIDTDIPVVRYIEIPRERGVNKHFTSGRAGREQEGMILIHGSQLSPSLSLTLSTHPLPPSSITYKSPSLALVQLPRGLGLKRGAKVGVVGRRGDGVCVRWDVGVR